MIKILYTLLIISSCYIEKTSALTFDFGLTLASSNSEQDAGVGFNLDLIFGKKGSQFVIGTTKALQKNKQDDLYRSTEMLDLNFRLNNISAGLFYGGVVSNVEDFLSSWNFNRIEYQYGYSFEIFFNVNQSWIVGVEARRHIWIDENTEAGYNSYWLNLNYIFNI